MLDTHQQADSISGATLVYWHRSHISVHMPLFAFPAVLRKACVIPSRWPDVLQSLHDDKIGCTQLDVYMTADCSLTCGGGCPGIVL